MVSVALVLTLGVGLGVAGTWLARFAAHRVGFQDRPDGRRKVQTKPVALGGGLGVFFGILASLGISSLLWPELLTIFGSETHKTQALLCSSLVIVLLGLVDDAVELRARHKLLGQFLAIAILIGLGGYRIERLGFFGFTIELGLFGNLVTAFWFLATINAINLLDGMDGLLGTVGLIGLSAVAVMAFAGGHPMAGYVALAAAGSIAGFLIFNWPPATIYLGDCGSMLIGLLLATLSLQASLKGPTLAIVAPAVLLVLPAIDTTAAIIRRKLTGRGLAAADRGHLHHELLRHGYNRVRVLALVGGLAIFAAAGALVSTYLQNDFFAFIAGGAIVLLLLVSGLFGVAEYKLIRQRLTVIWHILTGKNQVELAVQLQGQTDWSQSWRSLLVSAEKYQLITAILDVNDPAKQEGYHARWDRRTDTDNFWRLELSLRARGKAFGKLTILGEGDTPSVEQLHWLRRIQTELEKLGGKPEASMSQIPAIVPIDEPDLAIQPVAAGS